MNGLRGNKMSNPWEEINISDYENHMKLDSVMQLQVLNKIMRTQFDSYPIKCAMVLGVAVGNGLEYVDLKKYDKIYGIDVNEEYLLETVERYKKIETILECIKLNLITEFNKLPKTQLVIANLLIEYIGYECFEKVVLQTEATYISCVIQKNLDKKWVSDSPYLHVFDCLEEVHHQIGDDELCKVMSKIGYEKIDCYEYMLPNKKMLIKLDFKKVVDERSVF